MSNFVMFDVIPMKQNLQSLHCQFVGCTAPCVLKMPDSRPVLNLCSVDKNRLGLLHFPWPRHVSMLNVYSLIGFPRSSFNILRIIFIPRRAGLAEIYGQTLRTRAVCLTETLCL